MRTSIFVQNLKCGGCAKTIVSKLLELENITEPSVDVETNAVSFIYKNSNDALLVKEKLRALGYPSIDSKNSMTSKAISFVSCAAGKMSSS